MKISLVSLLVLVSTSAAYAGTYQYSCQENPPPSCSPVSGMCLGAYLNVNQQADVYSSQTENAYGSAHLQLANESFVGGGVGDVEIHCIFTDSKQRAVQFAFKPEECMGKNPVCISVGKNNVKCTC